jgi:hypothetical protein
MNFESGFGRKVAEEGDPQLINYWEILFWFGFLLFWGILLGDFVGGFCFGFLLFLNMAYSFFLSKKKKKKKDLFFGEYGQWPKFG